MSIMQRKILWRSMVLMVLSLFGFQLASSTFGASGLPAKVIPLQKGWTLQSSQKANASGDAISSAAYKTEGWYPVSVPSTVVAGLVANHVYPDPHFGMNLRSYPGMGYKVGENFSNLPMPADSPFRVPWWYRTEFKGPVLTRGQQCWLHFDGINFRANVWLNGKPVAQSVKMAGAYRQFELNVSENVRSGQINYLAVEIFPPQPNDLAITFVDWNPSPPDKMMGLWRDVYLTLSGPVTLRNPFVETQLDLPSRKEARLTVMADLMNASGQDIEGKVHGSVGDIQFEQGVKLKGGEKKNIQFSPDHFPQLILNQPRLWWPVQMGPQNLYELKLEVSINGNISSAQTIRFGIRQVNAERNAGGHLGFKINGESVLIRGAGYTQEMLLRSTPQRMEDELRYVKDMNLNAIRLEGKLEAEPLFDWCDEQGILVLAGWCCCDHWEKWKEWKAEDYDISSESLRDQISRLRRHASLLVWMNGSDNPPPARVEKMYLGILKQLSWPNPVISSAKDIPAELSGPPGVKMRGPYEYVPPNYWYLDTTKGGAFGFNTETGPGPAVPPLESLKQMLPADKLWPINEFWSFHSGGGPFKSLEVFTNALSQRFGKPRNVEDYAMKAQAVAYESHRAMFEAFGRNQPNATGVIQWMLNNAWPSMIWHLYDYYLRPGGSYFGAKTACEPLHIQYSYDDRSVVMVNSTSGSIKAFKAKATVYNFDLTEKFTRATSLDAAPNSSSRIFTIPEIKNLSTTYFLKLTLEDSDGKVISRNFYWLSTQADQLDDPKSTWYYTPQKGFADFTALQSLPQPRVKVESRFSVKGADQLAAVHLKNDSPNLAFFLRLKMLKGSKGEEVLPIRWEDNYITLLPGEERQLQAICRVIDLEGKPPVVEVETWK
jgi:exo-1,4-beta-D-glucosaminidase